MGHYGPMGVISTYLSCLLSWQPVEELKRCFTQQEPQGADRFPLLVGLSPIGI